MAELIVGKKYKLISLAPRDEYRLQNPELIGNTFKFESKGNHTDWFLDSENEPWPFNKGYVVEECCGEGCCDVPPRNAEAYTMDETDYLLSTKANKDRLEENIQQTELDFSRIVQSDSSGILPSQIRPVTSKELGYLSEIKGLKESLDHNDKISEVFEGLHDLLQYKNSKYGNSGIEPINVFSKVPAETGLLQRLDDKIARIKNSPELRKNDVADVVGYLVLLCVTKGWTHFDEFKD